MIQLFKLIFKEFDFVVLVRCVEMFVELMAVVFVVWVWFLFECVFGFVSFSQKINGFVGDPVLFDCLFCLSDQFFCCLFYTFYEIVIFCLYVVIIEVVCVKDVVAILDFNVELRLETAVVFEFGPVVCDALAFVVFWCS